MWHGALLDYIAVERIRKAFPIVDRTSNGWTDGVRWIWRRLPESVYFLFTVVSVRKVFCQPLNTIREKGSSC